MNVSSQEWHTRFLQQARWTRDLRDYLFRKAGLENARRVLEVGCGTGAVTAELKMRTQARSHGLDIDPRHLALARQNAPEVTFTLGDAHRLPYPRACFDLSYCHFLLLWTRDSLQVVSEMKRVTRPGGVVLAIAEPDYGGRIDYPHELAILGEWQEAALRRQGAEPRAGRRLAEIFNQAGLRDVETGVLGGQWKGRIDPREWEAEWEVLQADLGETVPAEELHRLRELDAAAWERGERVLFVPTFYAWGVVTG